MRSADQPVMSRKVFFMMGADAVSHLSAAGFPLSGLNLSAFYPSDPGSHWSRSPDKLAALLDCPFGA
jgi:hypothetical protein